MEKSGARKGMSQCAGCSSKWSVFRRKKCCFSCKNYFCHVCIIRRPDKKMCCKKCQVLTASPLNKNDLLNLRSRDLVNYLSSKHISTSGCVEKEDLVNVLMKAFNGTKSPTHVPATSASTTTTTTTITAGNSDVANSPGRNSSSSTEDPEKPRTSGETCYDEDGIRIFGIDTSENGESCSSSVHSVNSEGLNEGDWVVVDDRVENSQNLDQGDSHNVGAEGQSSSQEVACSASKGKSTKTKYGKTKSGKTKSTETKSTETDSAGAQSTEIKSRETQAVGAQSAETKSTETKSMESQSTDTTKEKVHRRLKLSDITCSEDLETLTVKELKTLLMTNRTDYRGCVERAELIERASRLWSDYTLSRRDLEKLSLDELCKICMDAPIECVLLECGHMATCMTCGKQLSECPLCRQYVVRCVRTFKV